LRVFVVDPAEHECVTDCFTFREGEIPLLVSIPHDGRVLPDELAVTMTDAGRALPDTDWHVARLYDFANDLGASVITANFSRYVVDLNRPADDAVLYAGQAATGLCPRLTFDGREIYRDNIEVDVAARLVRYWRPYHDRIRSTLDSMRQRHGYALLWDAHSIMSKLPTLFEGELPVLNLGTYDGQSCDQHRAAAVAAVAGKSPYSMVVNGRFKGGFITRHYGDPASGIHAMQLEIAQRAYMDEATTAFDEALASQLRDTLRRMMAAFTMRA
jgi:N-formylglutamate amidohydrolase